MLGYDCWTVWMICIYAVAISYQQIEPFLTEIGPSRLTLAFPTLSVRTIHCAYIAGARLFCSRRIGSTTTLHTATSMETSSSRATRCICDLVILVK